MKHPKSRTVWFVVPPRVHLLDLSGPAQVFHEARGSGADYTLRFVSTAREIRSTQGLTLGNLEPLPETVSPDDLVVVAGIDSRTLDDLGAIPAAWLQRVAATGATVCSICSGAWYLAEAGLLDGRRCTTHWKISKAMQERYPAIEVVENRLFVSEDNIVTSAGIVSGIDTALWLLERDHGPLVVARVAREMVVYLRRDGDHAMDSIYLDYRTHLHPGVHRVQDWLIGHPRAAPDDRRAGRHCRNEPRGISPGVFRQATGVTLKDFSTRLKLEFASTLLHNPDLTLEGVAAQCGFKDPRQLRRLWKRRYGETPSAWKQHSLAGERDELAQQQQRQAL